MQECILHDIFWSRTIITSESEENEKIMNFCVQNEWRIVHNLSPFWISPSNVGYTLKSCNFLIPCPIFFKLSLISLNLLNITMKVTWHEGFGFPCTLRKHGIDSRIQNRNSCHIFGILFTYNRRLDHLWDTQVCGVFFKVKFQVNSIV